VQPLLNIAVRAARRAGEVIVRSLNRLESLAVTSKGRNDFVSEVDHAAEREIIATVRRHYPHHAFLAEESGRSGENDTVWIVDPLDGTTNFLHGFPVFSVSIAVEVRGRLEHAVVYDPMRQELFTASRGAGAHLENRRMRVSKARQLESALVATGFPYRANVQYLDAYMAMLRAVTAKCAGVRRPGSAALDLAYVAAGRVDAFWEIGLAPWDTASPTARAVTSSPARRRCTWSCWRSSRRTCPRSCARPERGAARCAGAPAATASLALAGSLV